MICNNPVESGEVPLIKHINIYAAEHRNATPSQVDECGKESQVRGGCWRLGQVFYCLRTGPRAADSEVRVHWRMIKCSQEKWVDRFEQGGEEASRVPGRVTWGPFLRRVLVTWLLSCPQWDKGQECLSTNDTGCEERRGLWQHRPLPPPELNPGVRVFHSQNLA